MTAKGEVKKRVEALRKEINHHRYLYHVLDKQEISDAALDSLKNELMELETQFPDFITADSPTQRVGGQALAAFRQVPHAAPMLSLVDAFSVDDLQEWEKRNKKIIPIDFSYFTELKIDGVAVSLIYRDGALKVAATRGDGRVGEDVTHNMRTIDAIPLQLREEMKGEVEVRGEVYMLKADFEKMNARRKKEGKSLFANPRNVSAGSIRQLDPKLAAKRPLRFYAWEIARGVPLTTRQEEYTLLQKLGFPVPPHAQLFESLADFKSFIAKEEKRRLKYPFQVDGLVLKVNNLGISRRLGIIGKAPRGSIAYKFAAEEATTVIEDIVVQIGRTGTLTPVAHLKPVSVAGTTVSRATLHNADEIERKDVRIGDTVIVHKAGDIIPEVVKVLPTLRPKSAKPFQFPKVCPVCGSKVIREENGAVYRCTNKKCFPVQREKILHAVSRAAFDIEGLGDKITEQLLQEGLIKDPADLWELTAGDLTPLEKFADKKAGKLVQEIQSRTSIPLARFLVALSIPNVGAVTAQDLAQEFKTLDKVINASVEKLLAIEGIGEKVAESIKAFFDFKEAKNLLKKYEKAGIRVESYRSTGKFVGKIFLFTGSLGDMTRDEAKQIVQAQGGKAVSSAGKEVDYVVVGEDAGSKAKKAEALGLTQLTPAEFKKMISQ
ncbi:MAG: NAD-dependent DNA ligase LigA [Candidatus Andersenbacteria bacterium]|nr:NAD-dependent DNA ligase LigA [Candidatus Andersenbacteria bacterium]